MGGTPPNYHPMHLYLHSELLTGGGYDATTDKYTIPSPLTAGVAYQVSQLQNASPFGGYTAYDATAAGEPYATAPTIDLTNYKPGTGTADSVWSTAYDTIKTKLTTSSPITTNVQAMYDAMKTKAATEWGAGSTALGLISTATLLKEEWQLLYAEIASVIDTSFASAQLSARQSELNVEFLQNAEKLMGIFNGLDSFDSTTYWSAVAQLDATRTREANSFYAELIAQAGAAALAASTELARIQASIVLALAEHAKAYGTSLTQAAIELTKSDVGGAVQAATALAQSNVQKEAVDIAYLELSLKSVEQYITANRQNIEDSLQLDVQDLLWDVQAFDHFNKAMGAISGAQVIPGKPNPILETISGVSSFLTPALGVLSYFLLA